MAHTAPVTGFFIFWSHPNLSALGIFLAGQKLWTQTSNYILLGCESEVDIIGCQVFTDWVLFSSKTTENDCFPIDSSFFRSQKVGQNVWCTLLFGQPSRRLSLCKHAVLGNRCELVREVYILRAFVSIGRLIHFPWTYLFFFHDFQLIWKLN